MFDPYMYLTIWLTNTDSIFNYCIPDDVIYHLDKVKFNKLMQRDFFKDVLNVLGNDGWQIVSTSVSDKNEITRFIFCKKV